MDCDQYRDAAKKLVDFICDYRDNESKQRVIPGEDIKANGLRKIMSDDVPIDGESFEVLLEEFKEKVLPRCVHWGHPNFHAYFPSSSSYPAMLGEMLSTGTNQIGFSWRSSPAVTEHEQVVLNMYAKLLDLPKFFLYEEGNKESTGGGALQNSASDCIFVALLTARSRAVRLLKGSHSLIHDSVFLPHMVAYTSEEAHSCVQKAAKIAIIRLRVLPTDDHGCLCADTLARAIESDVREGFTPIFVSATVGTTGTCAFDNIDEIGRVCKKYPTIWFHVDGAYGGNSFILPEMRRFKRGLEYADSFNANPNKLLLTTFDCSCFWVRKIVDLKRTMSVTPTYLCRDDDEGEDFRHFGIPLSRRFRSLKLWCVLRNYGVRGLQAYIRNHMAVAKHFESLVRADHRFSVENVVHLGLVCFRLLVPNATKQTIDNVNIEFLQRMNASGEIHMVPTTFHDKYIIRFCATNEKATNPEMENSWRTIQKFADQVLIDYSRGQMKFQQQGKRAFNSRFSFTRSVSVELFEEQKTKALKDGATAICICEEEHDNENTAL